ncbi:MAG: flavodoxin-dependent (E)-4-hydroxy-3-methylbut-2-enyl-diphosphate synthase [Treponema sp.]|nr:flavodoxin-dependent (E)-4-hydroxy-3-methylbut-2-enyl-diphosphate synthase [Treponema sp.]
MVQRKSRRTLIGKNTHAVAIGDQAPVAIQTMWKEPFAESDIKTIAARIQSLNAMGCEMVRFAVPDEDTVLLLEKLATHVSVPLVADVHFDYKIALRCLDTPIAKIRINPGNIGNHFEEVAKKASDRGIPIRIGINAGSLAHDLQQKVDSLGLSLSDALVEAAERELEQCERWNIPSIVLSIKASSLDTTIEVNRKIAQKTTVPLHIGVTEAGPLIAGVTRSAIALYTLLSEGIGDTIRVSLSDSPENEVIAAREILRTVDPSQHGITVISCPRCGRNSFDTHSFTEKWLPILYSLKTKATVAIMGCMVNGPGEARHADLGITGAGNKVLLFRHGKLLRTVSIDLADIAFSEALSLLSKTL